MTRSEQDKLYELQKRVGDLTERLELLENAIKEVLPADVGSLQR